MGAYVTHKQEIDSVTPPEPPQITSVNVPSSSGSSANIQITARGTDPDGDDSDLRWALRPNGDSAIRGLSNVNQRGPSFSKRMRLKNRQGRHGTANFVFSLTDEDGLSVGTTKSIRMSPDPLIFDLNGDGKVELTGGTIARKPVSLPSGTWDIEILRQRNNARYIINDANTNNGVHEGGNSTNASGSWKLGIESQDGN